MESLIFILKQKFPLPEDDDEISLERGFIDAVEQADLSDLGLTVIADNLELSLDTLPGLLAAVIDAAYGVGYSQTHQIDDALWLTFLKDCFPEKFESDDDSPTGGHGLIAGYTRSLPMGMHLHDGEQATVGSTGGTHSLEEALQGQGAPLSERDNNPRVSVHSVTAVDDTKFLGRITNACVFTWDGKYLLDTQDAKVRYLVRIDDTGPALYLDQRLGLTDSLTVKDLSRYTDLDSHAQIDGQIACAGEIKLMRGKVTYIDNQSGTYRPPGGSLGATLRWAHDNKILSKPAIAQWIASGRGAEVDDGTLRELIARKVWKKLGISAPD